MKGFISGSGKTCIAVVDTDIRIANLEVGHVVVTWEPARHGVADLVGLRFEAFALDETAERFGVTEELLEVG